MPVQKRELQEGEPRSVDVLCLHSFATACCSTGIAQVEGEPHYCLDLLLYLSAKNFDVALNRCFSCCNNQVMQSRRGGRTCARGRAADHHPRLCLYY